jgi:hypothetical protein
MTKALRAIDRPSLCTVLPDKLILHFIDLAPTIDYDIRAYSAQHLPTAPTRKICRFMRTPVHSASGLLQNGAICRH